MAHRLQLMKEIGAFYPVETSDHKTIYIFVRTQQPIENKTPQCFLKTNSLQIEQYN